MPIIHTPDSEYSKELRKWEQTHTKYAVDENGESRPGNPYVYRPYPRMLYKAHEKANGQYACMDMPPPRHVFPGGNDGDQAWQAASAAAERFTTSCQLTVHSEDEERQARNQGWRNSPKEALAFYEGLQQDIARAAAEANAAAGKMSDKAQRERSQREAATHKHVAE